MFCSFRKLYNIITVCLDFDFITSTHTFERVIFDNGFSSVLKLIFNMQLKFKLLTQMFVCAFSTENSLFSFIDTRV